MAQGGYGKGTVYQRTSDNRWIAAVTLPPVGGKRQRKAWNHATREGAQAKLDAYLAEHPPRPTAPLLRTDRMAAARAIATHTPGEWYAKVRACERRCAYCGQDCTGRFSTLEKDHIVPIARGGSDGIDNLAVACSFCNGQKCDMTGDEYLAFRAMRGLPVPVGYAPPADPFADWADAV